ncbi:hypothetical protein, partial [Cypionkella sp.]|uniref:hypothetical protein n=1 Tax=Cypionkella sp. TaxID=2811411 RepID=UPI00260D6BB7
IEALVKSYGIDFAEFRDYLHYDGNEPLGLISTSWAIGTDGKRLAIVPVSLADLLSAAESGKWQIAYPEHRLVDRGSLYFLVLPLIVGSILLLIALWGAWRPL